MFDKDKEIGRQLTTEFKPHEEFIVWDAGNAGYVETQIGGARKTVLRVSRKRTPGERFDVSTLGSAIADKVEQAEQSDFPAVVKWLEVNSTYGGKATVIQFVDDYKGGAASAGEQRAMDDRTAEARGRVTDSRPLPAARSDDDIPY